MDLNKVVTLRRWNTYTNQVENFDIELAAMIGSPEGYNMVDIGFHLLNAAREDMDLPPVDKNLISGEECYE